MTGTLQNTSQNQEHIGCAVSSWLTEENVCCPNFQNTSLVANFRPQIWLPDSHFGQFRAIGPMELLRPEEVRVEDQCQLCTLLVLPASVEILYYQSFIFLCNPPMLPKAFLHSIFQAIDGKSLFNEFAGK